ncbi:MAG TPA: arginine--tRNA ligase [Acidimicrobiia bacterium]
MGPCAPVAHFVIRDQIVQRLRAALASAGLPEPAGGIALDPAKQREHGDWQSNVALKLSGETHEKPRGIAAKLVAELEADPPAHVERVEIAGPGFLNFFLAPTWLHDVLRDVVNAGERYGRGNTLDGRRINLEFVSANPTGPLHAGGGRWVAMGDAIANLLASQGAIVHREYYLNDAGNQLDTFAASLYARYRGEEPPEDGYQGAYLVDMAARLRAELGDDVTVEQAREWGYQDALRQLREDLGRIGVEFDTWFSERTLHERGEVDDVLRTFAGAGLSYEHEGAVWLRTEQFGDQRDRVLVKSDGATTYLANDVAYHRDKFARGWEHLIDIWGADHHGQVKSLQAAMEALGFPAGEPEILLGQLVNLVRGGEVVQLSKRAGNVITLADILDEVDPDVCRLTFLLQSIDTAQTFDLEVVTAQSMENPVYYVQYAHARIASIGRKAAEQGVTRRPLADVDLSPLDHEREIELLRSLAMYPDEVASAADLRAPHRIATWVRELAGRFHGFYRDCRVISDDDALTQARLWLAEACRIGLADALGLLGVSAPDEMTRLDIDDEEPAADTDAAAAP